MSFFQVANYGGIQGKIQYTGWTQHLQNLPQPQLKNNVNTRCAFPLS